MIDCVYIAANARDIRFTRICIASVRKFYPDVEIRILRGGIIKANILRELEHCWGARPADFEVGDYGWGFVKFEPLFGRPGERFLVLDSDTVIAGPVLELWGKDEGHFLVDDEQQSEADTKRLYYNWCQASNVVPFAEKPQFVFNSGQWFGTAGVLSREDFSPWVVWDMPRKLRYPHIFKQGEQGIFNFVLNHKAISEGIRVTRKKFMRWPGHDVSDLKLNAIANGQKSRYLAVIHWAGFKSSSLKNLPREDVLLYFERLYYERQGGGEYVRRMRALEVSLEYWVRRFRTRFQRTLGWNS